MSKYGEDELRRLWERIPTFHCKPGCYDCCCTFLSATGMTEEDNPKSSYELCCSSLDSGKCLIYEDRPTLCRLFGASNHPSWTCPHGYGPRNKLAGAETVDIIAHWLAHGAT
jgi:hypothetical protein